MYDAKLCNDCWAKVQGQPMSDSGVQYAMSYVELCDSCKEVNDVLRKAQEPK